MKSDGQSRFFTWENNLSRKFFLCFFFLNVSGNIIYQSDNEKNNLLCIVLGIISGFEMSNVYKCNVILTTKWNGNLPKYINKL